MPGFVLARLSVVAPVVLAAVLFAIPADEARAHSDNSASFHAKTYPLHEAAITGDLDSINHFLTVHMKDANADGSSVSRGAHYSYKPLHYAARYGHASVASVLIAAGADVDAKNNVGETPLHMVAYYGGSDRASVISVLIAAGADVNAKVNTKNNEVGRTPLHDAASRGHAPVVSILIAAGADVNAKNNVGKTPLHQAADRKRATIIAILLATGADVNARDNNGETPLYMPIARGWGYAPVISILIAAGADVNAKNNDGETPLYRAAYWGYAVSILIVAGADVSAENNDGETPLYRAAYRGHAPVISILIAAGADVNAKNNNGETPLYGAAPRHASIVPILIAAGGHWGEACAGAATVNPAGASIPCLCEPPNFGTVGNCAESCGGLTPPKHYDATAGECAGNLHPCHATAVRKDDNSGCECPERSFSHGNPSAGRWMSRPTQYCINEGTGNRRSTRFSCLSSEYREYEWYESIPNSAECVADHAPVAHDLGGWTSAIRANNPTIVAHFIAEHDKDPDSGIYTAARYNSHLAASVMIENGANVDLLGSSAPLHEAVHYGAARMISVLLAANANPDIMNSGKETPLHLAAQRRDAPENAALISLLLAGGANPNIRRNYRKETPLHLAAQRRDAPENAALISLLLAGGANPNIRNNDDWHPLDLAYHGGRIRLSNGVFARTPKRLLMSALVAGGGTLAQPDGQDGNGDSPLHFETRAGRDEFVLWVLNRGANPDIANNKSETPMHYAAGDFSLPLVKLLAGRGANPDKQDEDGDSPLHKIARGTDTANNTALISLLLDKGANPNLKNNDGWRPLDLAFDDGGARDPRFARRMLMLALIEGGAQWTSECSGGAIPNENYRGLAQVATYPECKCPAHISQRDGGGACECPGHSHSQVNGRCLPQGSAEVDAEIAKMQVELARLRAALVSLNARLSLSAEMPREMVEDIAEQARETAAEIDWRRANFVALGRRAEAGEAPPPVALSDTAAECRMRGGEVRIDSGSGTRICLGLDRSGTFCLVDSGDAFPCRGLFKHVRRCNDVYHRPALNAFICGERCGADETARGRGCE